MPDGGGPRPEHPHRPLRGDPRAVQGRAQQTPHRWDPAPRVLTSPRVTCHVSGMSGCGWSSCREGCTGQPWECDQVHVSYTPRPTVLTASSSSPSSPLPRTAPLRISVKGCGYPPTVNCSSWLQMFGQNNSQFPCYYSGTMLLLV